MEAMERKKTIIRNLSQLLRHTGDQALSGAKALSLTTSVFQLVQDSLSMVSSTSSTIFDLDQEMLLNLEYLKCFLIRVPYLRIENPVNFGFSPREPFLPYNPDGFLTVEDLNQCQNLDLRRVDVRYVRGLETLRSHLQALQIVKCQGFKVNDVLSFCLADNAPPDQWTKLTRLTLSNDKLETLDQSFSLAPWIEILDLSRNRLHDTSGLHCLPRLACLNLSFNRLVGMPVLSASVCLTLQSLNLAYNKIENLRGFERLEALVELDVSWNLLMHPDALSPVSLMPRLKRLTARGNPFTALPDHRINTISWINNDSPVDDFVLDGVQLTRREVRMAGMSRLVLSPPQSPIRCESVPKFEAFDPPSLNITARGDSAEGSLVSGFTSVSERKRRRKKAREAVIADPVGEDGPEVRAQEVVKVEAVVNSESDLEHLETKRKIEELRNKFGEDNWLHSVGADKVHEILGIEKSEPPSLTILEAAVATEQIEKTPVEVVESESATETTERGDATDEPVSLEVKSSEMATSFYSLYKSGEHAEENPIDVKDAPEVTVVPVLYEIPGRDDETKPLELRLCDEYIRECDPDSAGPTRVKWFTHSIESCEVVRRQPLTIHMMFNTVRSDRRERTYRIEQNDYEALLEFVRPILAAQAEAVLAQGALQCVKCQAMFSHEVAKGDQDRLTKRRAARNLFTEDQQLACPNCKSTMVIELDQAPVPTAPASVAIEAAEAVEFVDDDRTPTEKAFMAEVSVKSTPRKNSKGSDIMTGSHPSAGSRPEKSAAFRDEVATSSSCDEAPTKTLTATVDVHANNGASTSSTVEEFQRSESSSDISVLSNPSQSSIEVLSQRRESLTTTEADVKTSAISPETSRVSLMLESSSSGSMAESTTTAHSNTLDVSQEGFDGSETEVEEAEDVLHMTAEKENFDSGYFSHQTGMAKHADTDTDTSSSTSAYLTCNSQTSEASMPSGMITANSTLDTTNEETVLAEPSRNGSETPQNMSPPDSFGSTDSAKAVRQTPNLSSSFVLGSSLMKWNYADFTVVDHRVELYCDLTLTQEPGEEILLVAKAGIQTKNNPKVYTGVLVMSNKKMYFMKVTKEETEDPSEWLQLVEQRSVTHLVRLVRLLGGQGIGLEFHPEQSSFLIFRDSQRTSRFVEQISQLMMENVRSTPLPVSELTEEEEKILQQHVVSKIPEEENPDRTISLFLLASLVENQDTLSPVSVVATSTHLIICSDFFQWVFSSGAEKLKARDRLKICDISGIDLHDSTSAMLTLHAEKERSWTLILETDIGVESLLHQIKGPWEKHHNSDLEEVICYLFSHQILRLHRITIQDSVDPTAFDLSEWIHVTSTAIT